MTNKEMAIVILETACEVMQVDMEQVKIKDRHHPLPDTRKLYWLVARDLITDDFGQALISFSILGGLVNRRHCTALIGAKRGEELRTVDRYFDSRYKLIKGIAESKLNNKNDIEIARWAQTMGTI